MNKNFLRVASFVIMAIFVIGCMGLVAAAEEFEIPVIEEITEEELIDDFEETDEFVAVYGEGDVAVIGENAYATLDDALAASSDGAEIIIVGEASITDAAVSNRRFLVKDGGSLTVNGGSIKGYADGSVIEAESGAVVTLNGVTVTENYSGDLRRGAVFMAAGSKLYIGGNTNVTMNRQAALFNDAGKLNTGIIGTFDNIRLVGSDILTVKADFTGNVGLWNANVDEKGKVSANYVFEIGLVEEGYTGAGTIFHDNYGGTTRISEGKILWEAECKIGEVEYPFLDRAIEVQSSSSNVRIELLKNIDINEHDGYLSMGGRGTVVIDGGTNKYTINCVGKDRTTPGSVYEGKDPQHILGSIHINSANVTFTNVNLTRTYKRAYGYLRCNGANGIITLSDNTFLGGTASKKLTSSNGGAVFIESNTGVFNLNGENARIEYTSSSWGSVAAFSSGAKVNIIKGTVANASGSGCIGVRPGTKITISGGDIGRGASDTLAVDVTGTGSVVMTGGDLGKIAVKDTGNFTATGGTLGDVTATGSATVTATGVTLGDINATGGAKVTTENVTAKNVTLTSANASGVISAPVVSLNNATVGTVTIDDAETKTTPKLKVSGKINATSISMTLSDAIVLAGSITSDAAIPVSVAEQSIRFGTTEDVSYTGAECFVNKANTKVEGRRYVPGTSFANENTRNIINNRNVGRETALIFDYSFIKVLNDETDFFKGTGYGEGVARTASVPGESLVNAFATGYTVYMLKDVSCYEDVYESSSKINNVSYYNHSNMTGSSTVRILDGNGFTLIGDGSGGEDNANYAATSHVFRFYNSTNITFKNFTFDGKGFKKFANAEYVNDTNLGGNVTLENCWIKNTASGSISFSDGTFTIRNSIIENCSGTHTIHVRVPKKAGESTTLVISDSSIINNKVGTSTSAAAVLIENGATANVSGNINISGNTLNNGTVANVKTSGTNAIKVVGDLTGTMYISNTSGSHIGEVISGSVAEGVILGDAKYETGSYSVPFTVNGAAKWVSYKTYKTLDYLRQDNNIYLVAECYLNNDGLEKTTSFYKAMGSVAADGTIHLLKDINIAEARNDQSGWNFAGKIPYTIDGHGHTLTLGQTVASTSEHGTVSRQLIANIQLYGTHINFKNVILDANGSTGTYLFTLTGGAKVSFTDGTVIKNYNCNGGTIHGLIVVQTQSHTANTDTEAIYAGKAIFNNAKVINCNAPNGQLIRLNAATNLATPQVQLEIVNSEFSECTGSNMIFMDRNTQATITGSNFHDFEGRFMSAGGNSLYMEDSVIENFSCVSKTANGGALYIIYGSNVNLKDVDIINCKVIHEGEGSTAGGAVFVTEGSLTADKLNITNCKAGTQGSAIYVSADTTVSLKDSVISGCNSGSASGGAIRLAANGNLILSGNTVIKNNTLTSDDADAESNISIINGGNLTIAADFVGEIGVTGEVANIVAADGFETLTTVESLTMDGTNGATFAYFNGENFVWVTPKLTQVTDAGLYSDGTGTIRFKTTFTSVDDNAVEAYGLYAISADAFTLDGAETHESFKTTPVNGKSYYVDVINIPNGDEYVSATSFVKFKGIATPYYKNFTPVTINTAGNGWVKDLGVKA